MPDERAMRYQPTPEEIDAIDALAKRLHPDNPVRRIALNLIRGKPVDNTQPLIDSLARPSAARWRERTLAAMALGRVPHDATESSVAADLLLDTLENSRRESLLGRVGRAFGTSCVLVLPFCVRMAYQRVSYAVWYWGFWRDFWPFWTYFLTLFATFAPLATPVVYPFWLAYDRRRNARVRAAAARSLGHLAVPESANALAKAAFDSNEPVHHAAIAALRELLPTLSERHQGLFGVEAMQNLGRLLSIASDSDTLLVLHALEKIGNSHALPFVQSVSLRGATEEIREVANRTLAAIRSRQENQQELLLRAANSPYDSADTLLRPARSGAAYDSRELLRPVGTESEDESAILEARINHSSA